MSNFIILNVLLGLLELIFCNMFFVVVDSFGKPGAGLALANTLMLGSYSECVNITSPDGHIEGKYCVSEFKVQHLYVFSIFIGFVYEGSAKNLVS